MTWVAGQPHPYQLGPRGGRWQPHGCKHCDQRPGADIHDPQLWDVDDRPA